MNHDDQLLTIPDVAALLGVPVATIRWWRHRGEGPRSFKIGRHVKFQLSDVEAFIDQQRQLADRSANA